jgi:serine/threonine-protein kinase RsbW
VTPDDPSSAPRPVELKLPPSPTAAAQARRYLDGHLVSRLPEATATNLKLVVTELVTNAVVHGAGEVTVRLQVLDDAVRVEVIDAGTRSAPAIRREAWADGGFGLRIVEAPTSRWGVFDGSTHVWAELPRTLDQARGAA